MDTPSGVEEVLESTRLPDSQSQPNSRPSVSSEISDISSASQVANNSLFGEGHNSRRTQTPEEMAEALSQAVDDLDLTNDTQVWAEDAALDLSPNLTSKTQKSHSNAGLDAALDHDFTADTQVWAQDAALDLSPNLSSSTQNYRQKSLTGTERPVDDHPINSASIASLRRTDSRTSTGSRASSVKSTQSKGPFICEHCEKHCASKSGLMSHVRVHKKK